jgi:hypothetical protein
MKFVQHKVQGVIPYCQAARLAVLGWFPLNAYTTADTVWIIMWKTRHILGALIFLEMSMSLVW